MRLLLLVLLLASLASAQAAHSVTLNWTWSPAGNTGDPPTGFNVKKGGSSTGPWFQIGSTNATTFTFTDTVVTAGQTLFYALTSFNAGGESVLSAVMTCTIPFQAPSTSPLLQSPIVK